MATCAECGQANPGDARFCNACGAALAEPGPSREVRKTVTVLFCDVTGSTALGESLDPEPLRALLARYFEQMKAIVERHGGTVEKFIGDAVMAVFGVPAVHEDDALRALRAAVEMRDSFPALGIEGRIGVSTGEVVSGTEERLATGDAVNVAARLEQAARPGEVLVSEPTFRLARDAAEVEQVEPLVVKGKSAPLAAYRLISVREGAAAFTRHLDSPMVGRERERGLLRQAFERARDERACHLFTVLGPAGIGKSRLVGDLVDTIGSEATIVSGRCLPYGEGITYWPLLEILDGLGRQLEIAAPEETAWAARKVFEEIAAERPLVVVLDDIHWAEPTFLDLIEHVADLSRDAPILVMCVARPELLDSRPGWGGGKLNATTILLEPLGEGEIEQLVSNLLDDAALPDAVLRRVEAAAEGNPLFVEEMLAMLAEDGVDGDIEVPPTIQALLAARLDRLDSAERDVLGRASVEGKVFHAGGVATLAPEGIRPAVRGYLTGLVRKELIRPDRASIEGEEAFRFRHLLIRDAAYQSLPKEERADLHERFVGWLESFGGGVGFGEIAGYHLEQAYRYLVELGHTERARRLAGRAAATLGSAGVAASRRGDLPSALSVLQRAEGLLPSDSPERLRLLPELGEVLADTGRFVEAEAILTEAIERAEADGARDVVLRALVERTTLRLMSAPVDHVEETQGDIERLLPELEQAGDERTLSQAARAICMTYQIRCQYDLFETLAQQQLEHATRAGDQRLIDDALVSIAVGLIHGPTPVDEAIDRILHLPAPRGTARHATRDISLAVLYAMAGRYEEVQALHGPSRERVRELGHEVIWASYAMSSGWIALWKGDAAPAEPIVREGCEALIRMGERSYLSTASAVLAHLLYELGRDEEAEEWLSTAEETGSPDDLATQAEVRTVRALILARRGRLEEAEQQAREAVDIADRGQSQLDRGSTRLVLASVLRSKRCGDDALRYASEALQIFEQKGIAGYAEQARSFIAGSSGG